MDDILKHYIDEYPELAGYVTSGSQNMILFSKANGEIIWANQAFLQWIGYTLDEFTRKDNPVTWRDISVRDGSLDADIRSIAQLKDGKIANYIVRKFYVPKHGSPHFVELFVRRYPAQEDGDMVLAVVEVTVLHNTHAKMAQAYEEMTNDIKTSLDALSEANKSIVDTLENQLTSGLNGVVLWLAKHPAVGIPVAAILVLLLFGERAIEVIQKFMTVGGG